MGRPGRGGRHCSDQAGGQEEGPYIRQLLLQAWVLGLSLMMLLSGLSLVMVVGLALVMLVGLALVMLLSGMSLIMVLGLALVMLRSRLSLIMVALGGVILMLVLSLLALFLALPPSWVVCLWIVRLSLSFFGFFVRLVLVILLGFVFLFLVAELASPLKKLFKFSRLGWPLVWAVILLEEGLPRSRCAPW